MYLFSRIQTVTMHEKSHLCRVQNAAKIKNNMGEIFVKQFYGRLKELFDFNKLGKLIHMINFRMVLFIKKLCQEIVK